jgi:hypothetical protein
VGQRRASSPLTTDHRPLTTRTVLIVHPPSIRTTARNRMQLAPVRRSAAHGELAYRCCLPALAGFTGVPLRRTRPSTPLTPVRPQRARPRVGVQPRYSGLRVQGTASSPSSTTKAENFGGWELGVRAWELTSTLQPPTPNSQLLRPHYTTSERLRIILFWIRRSGTRLPSTIPALSLSITRCWGSVMPSPFHP